MTDEQTYNESTSLKYVSETIFNWTIQDLNSLVDSGVKVTSNSQQFRGLPNCYFLLTCVLSKKKNLLYDRYYCTCGKSSFETYKYDIGIRFRGNVPFKNVLFINISICDKVKKFSIENRTSNEIEYGQVTFNLTLYKEIDVKCSIEQYQWENQRNEVSRKETSSLNVSNNKCRWRNYLQENLGAIYNNPVLTDIILYVDGHKFEAHKVILAANSPVFESMFTLKMRENHENIVYIQKISLDIFEIFLNYMYTQELRQNIKEEAFDLIIVADRYQVNELKIKCVDTIKSIMDVNNVITTLNISHVLNDENLKIHAFEYIACNLKEVQGTEDYKLFAVSNSHVLIELYEYMHR